MKQGGDITAKGCFKVAICQMSVTENKTENNQKACDMIARSASNGADIVILPEMFNCPYDKNVFSLYAEEDTLLQGETIDESSSLVMLKKAAEHNSVYIAGGTIPEKNCGQLYNTCFCFDRKGAIIGKYRKINLFEIDIADKISFNESDTLSRGDEIVVIDTEFCKIGIAICFDIRFPDIFREMRAQGADLFVIPGSFNMITGPAHWELLLRTRAVDNQVFVAACSSARNEDSTYMSYANSLAINPWGDVIANAGSDEKIIYITVDLQEAYKLRVQIPVSNIKLKCIKQ